MNRAHAANFTVVAAGESHTCALASSAAVQCWGRNAEGESGDGTGVQRLRPVTVPYLSFGATSIGTGQDHSCAVLALWTSVKCWGRNMEGQIGDGTIGTNRLSPVTVCASGSGGSCVALTGVIAAAGGDDFTCALASTGAVKCWGRNTYGQLGNGTTTDALNPVNVSGLSSGVSAISAGGVHACALTMSGAVKCWGRGTLGELGDGTATNRSSPVDVSGLASGVSAISAGSEHTCALLSGGGVKCWGGNGTGQLGDGTGSDATAPVSVCQTYDLGTQTCTALLANITKISAGTGHTCAVTLASGRNGVKCWGWDGFGQLGNGGTDAITDFVLTPVDVTGLTAPGDPSQAGALSAGAGHTCAVLNPSGAVTCWGWNADGQLGTGTLVSASTWQMQQEDFDKDGCADYREQQTASGSQTTGGLRSPKNFWDFFDTPDDHRTTLSTAIPATGPPATITVASTANFPTATTSAPKTLFVDNEKFTYTGQTSTTFTITARAVDGTTMASHAVGAPVVSGWRDGVVTQADVDRVTARNNATGSASADPLGPPPAAPAYFSAYDRSYVGPNVWNLGPADGTITAADVTRAVNQNGHDCR